MGIGDIGFSTYKSYISAAGGPCIAIICTLCYLITFGVVVFADVWLSKWIGTFEVRSKIEKVPRGIRGEKPSKDMASSRNLVSTIGALASPKMGDGTRCPEG